MVLEKKYNPQAAESQWQTTWQQNGIYDYDPSIIFSTHASSIQHAAQCPQQAWRSEGEPSIWTHQKPNEQEQCQT